MPNDIIFRQILNQNTFYLKKSSVLKNNKESKISLKDKTVSVKNQIKGVFTTKHTIYIYKNNEINTVINNYM